MRRVLFLLIPVLAATPVLGATCEEFYERLMAIHQHLPGTFDELLAVSPELIRGEKTPNWRDIDTLEKVLASIRGAKKDLAEEGRLEELRALAAEMAASIPDNPQLVRLRDAAGDVPLAKEVKTYQPTEYELKRLYQNLLYQVNKELPRELRIPGVRIPYDPRRTELVEQAREVLRRQEKKFETVLHTSGFPDMKSYEDAVRAQGGAVKEVFELLREERVEAVIRRPRNARWWTPRVGFHNQRVTGSTGGSFTPDGRDKAEAYLTFEELSKYKAVDNDLKPKYGYLRPAPDQPIQAEDWSTGQYGDDFYIMKLDRLRDRMTWTVGDSLGRGMRTAEGARPEHWHHSFAPWKDRGLMAPYFAIDAEGKDKLFRISYPAYKDGEPLKPFDPRLDQSSYLELQFWGPITLDDVEVFEFTKMPPEPEFHRELVKRGIKVRDARLRPATDWPPAPGAPEGKSTP